MSTSVELTIDVTEAAVLGQPCHAAVTVHLPATGALPATPVVCFALPGGGYCRRYFSFDLPGASGGGQAGWHTDRGWILVAVDTIGAGDSTVPEVDTITFEAVSRAIAATVRSVLAKLAAGNVLAGFPPVVNPVTIGIGQSMGGCFLVVTQAQHGVFDGIGVLGYSAVHTIVPSRPGTPPIPMPWMSRATGLATPIVLNQAALTAVAAGAIAGAEDIATMASQGEHPFAWAFHWDDEPADVVAADLGLTGGPLPSWKSATTQACGILMVAPGAVAAEAAALTVPVLVAVGERDVVPDPWIEPRAYKSATDITVFVCPRMAHMHNFASTREQFWSRVHEWGNGVATTTTTVASAR